MAGVWSGLGESAFLQGLNETERDGPRLTAAVVGGLILGVVAAAASWCLIMVPYTLWAGLGADGLEGLGRAAQAMVDPRRTDLDLAILRLAVTSIVDGAFLLVFAAFAAAVARQPLHSYITAARQVRWRLLLVGMGLAVLALAPIVTAEGVMGGAALPILAVSPGLGGRLLYGATSLLLVPAAAAEELVFRGWLVRRTAAFSLRPAVMIIFTGVLFAAAHLDFNPDAFLTRALMGAGFAYMTLRLGGIEFSAGVHATHNMLIVIFLAPLNLQSEPPSVSAFSLMEDIGLLAGYVIITEAVVHISWLRRWAGVRLGEISPPDDQPPSAP